MQGLEAVQTFPVVRLPDWTGWRGLCRFPTRPNESPKEILNKKASSKNKPHITQSRIATFNQNREQVALPNIPNLT